MVKPAYTIAMAAIMVAAVFAGVVLMDDEADAAEGDYTITYLYNGASVPVTYSAEEAPGGVVTLKAGNEIFLNGPEEGQWLIDGIARAMTGSYTFPSGVTSVTATYVPEAVAITIYKESVSGIDQIPYNTEITITAGDAYSYAEGVLTVPMESESKYFAGFATTANGSATITTSFVATEDVTLYPVYEEDSEVKFFNEKVDLDYKLGYYQIVKGFVPDASGDKEIDDILGVPTQPNYTFIGWSYNGTIVISHDAAGYKLVEKDGQALFTKDMAELQAEFSPNNMTVTLMTGETQYGQVTALFGNAIVAPELPPGYAAWCTREQVPVLDDEGNPVLDEAGNPTYKYEYTAFDFATPITADIVLYAVASAPDENIYVTFNIEGTLYGPYAVNDRFSIPQTDREGYNFLGWTIQGGDGTRLTSAQVQNYQYTEDVTFVAIYEVAEPPAPEEPAFYETTTGQVAIIIVVFVLLFFGYAVYSNMGGLKDKLFGYTISKKEKKE